jgi:hypothetical protein
MSAAFIKGIEENLPEASITFDKFHGAPCKAVREPGGWKVPPTEYPVRREAAGWRAGATRGVKRSGKGPETGQAKMRAAA